MIEEWMVLFYKYSKMFVELSKSNPALAGFIGLYSAGVVAYFTRELPSRIYNFATAITYKQFTITVNVANDGYVFDYFMKWYEKKGHSNKSRTLRVEDDYRGIKRFKIGAGLGNHYFMHGRRIFRLTRIEKDLQNSKEVKEKIIITTYGRSREPFEELFDTCCPDRKETINSLNVYKHASDGWEYFYEQDERNISTVVLREQDTKKLLGHIDTFHKARNWYTKNGIPYRTGILLQGPGGTGKTSIIKALCSHYKKTLYTLSLNNISDSGLESALATAPSDCIVLIEDIDAFGVSLTRTGNRKLDRETEIVDTGGDAKEIMQAITGLSMSGILNSIDGIAGSNGRILIATTNHPEQLDAALVRPGRFDLIMDIGYLVPETFIKMFAKFYPDFVVGDAEFKQEISPAKFQFLAMCNLESPENVLDEVRK